jgi:ABC-type dipeptide/oligopeptide/nickel transport system permease component
MFIYVIKRLFYLIPLIMGITFLTFLLTSTLPGDPALSLVGERASPEVLEQIRQDIGADKPFLVQYLGYLKMLFKGQMGTSYFTKRDVFRDIIFKFPNTLLLAFAAMLIATPLGLILGFFTAERRGSMFDRTITSLSITGLSGLPAITLSLPAIATIARITRTSVIDVYDMPFVTAARSKGLRHTRLRIVHVLRNVIIPVVTVVGLDFGSYLNGSVLTETIFGWDGIGRFTMEGIIMRDYPVIMGCIVTGTIVFVLINLLVDITYHYLDPRVRLHEVIR